MGESELNCEASGESSGLLDKKDETAPLSSVPSGRIVRQYRGSGPSKSTQYEPLQGEIMEVRVDHRHNTQSPENDARIFEVVTRGDQKELSNLLKTKAHSIDKNGNTFLHHAVASAGRKGDWDDSLYQCIDLLMRCKQLEVNRPNNKGYTAIGLAVHQLHKTCVEYMLKHRSADRLYLDCYPGDRESTVREIIKEAYPFLQPILPTPLKESLDSSERDIKLLAALQRGAYNVFRKTLDSNNPNPWYDEPYHSSLLELACQMNNREIFVKFLLEKGADPNSKNHVTGMPLLHATARSGNFEWLKLLLEKDGIDVCLQDNEQRTILHWLAQVRERNPGDKYILEKCFKLIMDKHLVTRMGIDIRDVSGNTALYIALQKGFRDRAELLLSEGADISALGNACPVSLPTTLPLLEEILDNCLMSNDELLTSTDLLLSLNNELLTNMVPHIAESQHLRELLKHPVISAFLFLKWLKVRYIFFLDMAFYVIFLCFLTVCILLSEPYNTLNDGVAASKTTDTFSFNDSNITSGINDSNFISQQSNGYLQLLKSSLMFFWVFLSLREALQLIVYRWVYIKSLENWLEILLIISTFISCSGVVESAELKLHSSAVALLLGWSELLMLSGRLPQLSVHLVMFRTVSLTFLWYMMSYVTLLIAFALSFYILFKGNSEQGTAEMFANLPISLLKTIVMFTGEFDTSSLSFGTLPYTSHVIFLLFVVMVAIVLLNLLNGLAVNDTGEIRKDAETLSLAARAKLISRIERLENYLRKYMKYKGEQKEDMFLIYPNRKNRIGSAAVRSLLRIISEKTKIHEKEKSTAFPKEWRTLTEKLSALEYGQRRLENKLDSMCKESR
jgi:ankyrin repeat protein